VVQNKLTTFLGQQGFKDDESSPSVFIRRYGTKFATIAIYVDDLSIVCTKNCTNIQGKATLGVPDCTSTGITSLPGAFGQCSPMRLNPYSGRQWNNTGMMLSTDGPK
jgi:hypothetical protein